MGTAIMIGQLILALAILVTLHELGHFLVSKKEIQNMVLVACHWAVMLKLREWWMSR